jgi:amidohydrolase
MTELARLRRLLHSQPELAGEEEKTARLIQEFVEPCRPDQIVSGIGGFGLAAVVSGTHPGPRVLVRAELDALPISERTEFEYRSNNPGISHKCGHDGHLTILAGLARRLCQQRPTKGSVVLLFQPAEETGEGAARVLADPRFTELGPDYVVALHNLPGYLLGQVITREGCFAAASSGLIINLRGKTSHAAEPEAGRSPTLAVAQLIAGLSSITQFHTALHQMGKVTVIHARLGEVAFGTSPGEAEIMATLRSYAPEVLETLSAEATRLARELARTYELEVTVDSTQVFPATINNSQIVVAIERAAVNLGLEIARPEMPFAWSEDFGHFTARYPGALFGLGAGETCPPLHHPEYDFPEALIEPGVSMFLQTIENLLGQ